ncbi:hypothetical protein RhiirB3_489525 [Rhizophagus irregularis]|nr:hypothetical protein RhiirB3_489525 [Rhizophagus irregularis]
MSITLLCLVKGNTLANAFPVDIEKDQLVGHLKKVIKAENPQTFANVDVKDIKLWKVEIGGDHLDDQLKNLKLNGSDELSAINEIGDYWTEKPPKKHIHVLVEPPVTTTASNEVLELREKLASLQALLNKSVHGTVRCCCETETNEELQVDREHRKNSMREMEKPPALENDGAVLNIINDSGKFSPRNDQDLRKILQLFVSNVNLKFTVLIETPSKPFNEWTFPKVCELYGLSDDPNPSIDVYPVFSCGSADLSSEQSKAVVKHLLAELKLRQKTTPFDMTYEATKSIYSYCYLASGVSFYDEKFKIIPEKLITGHNGQGNLDYAIECRSTNRVVGLVEVKRDDFKQGFAQATVQMESSLTCRKRKVNEIDDSYGLDKVWGIVTDAEKWYFMECMLDGEGKPSFKLSEPVIVVYKE